MKNSKILLLIIACLIVACCPCRKNGSKYRKPMQETNWRMVQFEGRTFDAGERYYIVFHTNGRLEGYAGCNRFSADYTVGENGLLSITSVNSSQQECADRNDGRFISMFSSIDHLEMDGSLMMLLSSGELVAIFEEAPVSR